MLFIFVGIVSLGILVVIALLTIGSAVAKSKRMPAQIVIDINEAIEFCAQALPESTTAVLSYDELRKALRLHLEWIQAFHYSPEKITQDPIVFEQFEVVPYMQERATITGLILSEEQIRNIIQAHNTYLEAAGALTFGDQELAEKDLAALPSAKNTQIELP